MTTKFNVVLLPGDGIGPDVTYEAVRVLEAVEAKLEGVEFAFVEKPCGANEYLRNGDPLPAATVDACRAAHATLLGAMGLPGVRWPSGTEMTPQIDIRETLDLYAGMRPIKLYNQAHSPLKPRPGSIDFVLYRENCEGLFFGRKGAFDPQAPEVRDIMCISRRGAERICRAAFHHAMHRRKQVTLVDKANVLPSMAYFRGIFHEVAKEFPEVKTDAVYVDAASLYLVQRPESFDVLVTENMFGDILSDLAAGLVGGMGMAPSADIGDQHAVFQPSHGTAPDIAGKSIANPIATILSAALMLEWLGHPETIRGARLIEAAVAGLCNDASFATRDLGGSVSTTECGAAIAAAVK
ncbi:MAG: isocitrate/isopropylmalate dehydrogenase family protein [Acidobacteria bacterium]|nr:isocitrate/isopropylmalate dehydrogenase family protein [Acidobacteriota bacterium]